MGYSIFDFFKTHESGAFGEGNWMFSPEHIIFICIAIPLLILLPILLRNKNHKSLTKFFTFLWIFLLFFDISKMVWEGSGPSGFNYAGNLPLYPCSTYLFVMPFVVFSKNEKVRHFAMTLIVTLNLGGGLFNFFIPSILYYYPLLTFGALHSLIYHFLISFTALLMFTTGYYKYKKYDAYRAFAVLLIFAVPVIILDKIFINNWFNYFWFNNGGGTPLDIIYNIFKSPTLWTFIMLLLYLVMFHIIYIPQYIVNLVHFYKNKNQLKTA